MSTLERLHAEHLARKQRLWTGRKSTELDICLRKLDKTPPPIRKVLPPPPQKPPPPIKLFRLCGRDLSQMPAVRVAVNEIIKIAAEFYSSDPRWNPTSRSKKKRRFILPRQVAMFIALGTHQWTTTVLGRIFERDHSTIIYGAEKIRVAIQTDVELRDEVGYLRDLFMVGVIAT